MYEDISGTISRQMGNVFSNLELSRQCQQYNSSIVDTINQYKREEASWYDYRGTVENGFSTTTQSFWYSHYLNKKRLDRHGIGVHYEYIQPTIYSCTENNRLPYFSYSHDGKNMICKVDDGLRYRKVWFRNRQILWFEEPNGKEGQYYLVQSKAVNGNLICPNCGHEDTVEAMLDGCNYCNTKFNIQDFNQKVSSLYVPKSMFESRDNNPAKKIVFPIIWLFLGLLLSICAAQTPFIRLLTLFITFAGFIGIIALMTVKNDTKGAARNTMTKDEIRKTDPYFSEEYFLSNLMSRILSIHYAERMDEVQAFVNINISEYLQQYQDIIECSLNNYILNGYHTDAQRQYMEVTVELTLKYDNGGTFSDDKEKLHLSLTKSINARTGTVSDAIVYSCKGCGASLSLLNGGKCEYCGREINLSEYDWVITGYQAE